jgi:ubiquinone/menaquinone biosynthesis C-methylase UbiE
MTAPLNTASAKTRRRYDRNAPLYDMMEHLMESRAFQGWRQRLWGLVEGEHILEVGVGTGKNMPCYPAQARITGIDLSPRMLKRARKRAGELSCTAVLREMDVQQLEFPDGSFDAAVSTFVFCSVADPIAGLREIRRILRPGGKLYMLEHVLSHKPVLRQMMNVVNPVVVRVGGANINRETRLNLEKAGFSVLRAEPLWSDIFWLFVAGA